METAINIAGTSDARRDLLRHLLPIVVVGVLVLGAIGVLTVGGWDGRSTADDGLYASLATRWLNGEPMQSMSGEPVTTRAPIYPVSLALVIGATGGDWSHAEQVVATLAMVTLLVVAAGLGRMLMGPWTGVFVIILVGTPTLVIALASSAIDALQAAILVSGVAVLVWSSRTRWSLLRGAVVGILLGLAVLTKETALPMLALPLLVAISWPGADLRSAIRFATLATGTALLVILPWWAWVYAETGRLFPTRITGPVAAVGIATIVVVTVVVFVATVPRFSNAITGALARVDERTRWFVVIGLTGCVVAIATAGFFVADPRFAFSGRPSFTALTEGLVGVSDLFVWPIAVPAVIVAGLVMATSRPSIRHLVIACVLASSFLAVIVIKRWDPRSIALLAVLSSVLLGAALAYVLKVFESHGAIARRASLWATATTLTVVLAISAVGYATWWRDRPIAPVSWQNVAVKQTAAWLSANAEPGDTIVMDWLYATSLDAETRSRYRIFLAPTLQLRLGDLTEPALVPTGTLFRDTSDITGPPPGDWVWVQKHPTEGYWVGLSADHIAGSIRSTDADWYIVSGDQVPQASISLLPSLTEWPGLTEVFATDYGTDRMVVFAADSSHVAVDPPPPLYIGAAAVRQWLADSARLWPTISPGDAFRRLVGDRDVVVSPYDLETDQIVIDLLNSP